MMLLEMSGVLSDLHHYLGITSKNERLSITDGNKLLITGERKVHSHERKRKPGYLPGNTKFSGSDRPGICRFFYGFFPEGGAWGKQTAGKRADALYSFRFAGMPGAWRVLQYAPYDSGGGA